MTSHHHTTHRRTRERHVHTRDGAPVPGELLYRVGPPEEVIVGRLDGAVMPTPHVTVTYNVPRWPPSSIASSAGGAIPVSSPALRKEDLD